jgi:hypothetical protein
MLLIQTFFYYTKRDTAAVHVARVKYKSVKNNEDMFCGKVRINSPQSQIKAYVLQKSPFLYFV